MITLILDQGTFTVDWGQQKLQSSMWTGWGAERTQVLICSDGLSNTVPKSSARFFAKGPLEDVRIC